MAAMKIITSELVAHFRVGRRSGSDRLLPEVAAQSSETPAGPDPQEIPIPPIKTSLGTMPGVKDLPVRPELPDVMTMNDGTKVKTVAQWKKRREEIRRSGVLRSGTDASAAGQC